MPFLHVVLVPLRAATVRPDGMTTATAALVKAVIALATTASASATATAIAATETGDHLTAGAMLIVLHRMSRRMRTPFAGAITVAETAAVTSSSAAAG